MKKIKMAIRAVLSLGVLLCLIFGAAGCQTEQKMPEGDKVAIGFLIKEYKDIVYGPEPEYASRLRGAIVLNRRIKKDAQYFTVECYYGHNGIKDDINLKALKIYLTIEQGDTINAVLGEEEPKIEPINLKMLSGEKFYKETSAYSVDFEKETDEAKFYRYGFHQSFFVNVPIEYVDEKRTGFVYTISAEFQSDKIIIESGRVYVLYDNQEDFIVISNKNGEVMLKTTK